MRRRDRDQFGEVATAARELIDIVLAQDQVTDGQYRMALAVLRETLTSSRLWDERHRSQLSDIARVSQRTGSRSLDALHKLEAIEWRPGHRNVPSLIGLPGSARHLDGSLTDDHDGDHSEPPTCPADSDLSEPSDDVQRAKSEHFSETPVGSHQEKGFREQGFREQGAPATVEVFMSEPAIKAGHHREFVAVLELLGLNVDEAQETIKGTYRFASDFEKALKAKCSEDEPDEAELLRRRARDRIEATRENLERQRTESVDPSVAAAHIAEARRRAREAAA